MRTIAAVLCLTLVVVACGDDDDDGDTSDTAPAEAVTGTVTVADGGPAVADLPDDAVLTVTIEDTGLQDVAVEVIAEQEIDVADQEFPIEFEVPYDDGSIVASNPYSVSAQVQAGTELLLISDTVVPVITDGAPTSGVEVEMIVVAE